MGEASSPHGSLVTFDNRVPALPTIEVTRIVK